MHARWCPPRRCVTRNPRSSSPLLPILVLLLNHSHCLFTNSALWLGFTPLPTCSCAVCGSVHDLLSECHPLKNCTARLRSARPSCSAPPLPAAPETMRLLGPWSLWLNCPSRASLPAPPARSLTLLSHLSTTSSSPQTEQIDLNSSSELAAFSSSAFSR